MATFPCTDDPSEIIEAVVGAGENAEKFDRFVNGGVYEEVQLGTGEATPTLRNLSHLVKSAASTLDGSDVSGKFSDAANGGTELRTLADHFGDIVNVMDFGAAGDGVTDDTDALNAAVSAAEGKTLFLPAGTYVTCTGLRIPSNTRVAGAGIDQTVIKLCSSAPYTVDCVTNEQNWWNHPASIASYGAYTQTMQEANQGNENIVLEDLTADGSCSRAKTGTNGHSGSAVHFANVRNLRLRNVRGVNGWLHGIDVSSSMYTMDYDESGFGTSTVDEAKGPWYVGASEHVVLECCEGIDPRSDDCITTHYSRHIAIIAPYAYRNLTPSEVLALDDNKHGLEIDDGSHDVHVFGGHAENCCSGLQVKGHGTAYPAHDIVVDGFISKNCVRSFHFTCGGTVDYSKGRNIAFLNCASYQTASTSSTINGCHLYGKEYDNVLVKNMSCIGNGTTGVDIAFQLSQSCRNAIVENISFKDIPVDSGEEDNDSLIFVNSTIGPGCQFRNIRADNCTGNHVFRTTSTENGVIVDGVSAHRSSDDGSAAVFVSQGTARNPQTVIRGISVSGYANAYSEGSESGFSFPPASGRDTVVGNAETIWKRAVSSGSVEPENSYALNIGWFAESQDVQEDERILVGFKNKVRGEDEKILGYIGSNHDSPGDSTSYYGLIFGTNNQGTLSDQWEIRYDGRLVPCSDTQNVGYYEGSRPLNIYAHNVYSDSGTIGTSDETCKSNIVQIPDAVLDAWEDVCWVQFQLNDAIEKKGASAARLHCGAVAQRIKAAFEAHGLDAHRYGLICLETWTAEESPSKTAGSQYGLRYNECLAVEAAYQRRKVRLFEERLQAMEARLAALEVQ